MGRWARSAQPHRPAVNNSRLAQALGWPDQSR